MKYTFAILLAFFSCHASATQNIESDLNAYVPRLIDKHNIAGVGIALVNQKGVQFEKYYGAQAPDTALNAESVFNVASVAKTITAEVAISLLVDEVVSLDDKIYQQVSHPDLKDDPRYEQLTLGHLLSHASGLLNWPHSYADNTLAFTYQPGTAYSYSGAGIELAADFLCAVSNNACETMAEKYVFTPYSITAMAQGHIPEWAEHRLNTPMNKQGEFKPVETLNPGLAAGDADAAADDLITTVGAYAQFMHRLINQKSEKATAYRTTILTDLSKDDTYRCDTTRSFICPESVGHSVGWQVWQYPDHSVVTHSGTDAGETALVYFSPQTQTGAVIFINGSNGWPVLVGVMELLRQEPEMTAHFRQIINRVMNADLTPLLQE